MNRKRVLLMLLVAPLAWSQDGKDEGVFEAGVQHVCVPAADGEGWDCGVADAPLQNDAAPVTEAEPDAETSSIESVQPAETAVVSDVAEETPPPPPFLADPMRDTPYAAFEDEAPEPATAAEAVVAAEAAEHNAPAADVAPAPDAAPAVAPEVVPAPPVVHVPHDGVDGSVGDHAARAELVAAPATEPAMTPVAAPVETAAPATVVHDAPLGTASDFTRLPATAFTLQLAYAATAADFPRLVAALGLDPATCYALRIRGATGPVWLLAHGAYADANAAKAAQAQLPKVAGLLAQWPRRIGALQTEITQGH
jgi:septal ring-binding cell division protein DamX